MTWKRIHIEELTSTMDWLRNVPAEYSTDMSPLVVTADFQTCGRGQRGNHWEAERDKNLLIGMRFVPFGLKASEQFLLSEALSLAVVEALNTVVESLNTVTESLNTVAEDLNAVAGKADAFSVKWPNDIYYNDRKVCGMLLEHDLSGGDISQTIAGVGINVNQVRFLSDAPNPVSLFQILGCETDREKILNLLLSHLDARCQQLCNGQREVLHADYMRMLYRRDGLHTYKDCNGVFRAEIVDVGWNGVLHLRDTEGCVRRYSFKEVAFV